MSRDPNKIKDLIIRDLDLTTVMLEYRVQFAFDPRHAPEVQYRCPFHGKDNKPSARLYKQTKSCFCWYCAKKWDVISFIRDKESLSYYQALKYIVSKYKLDLSSIPDTPELVIETKKEVLPELHLRIECARKSLLGLRGRLDFDKYNVLCAYFLFLLYKTNLQEDINGQLMTFEGKIQSFEKGLLSAPQLIGVTKI